MIWQHSGTINAFAYQFCVSFDRLLSFFFGGGGSDKNITPLNQLLFLQEDSTTFENH